VALLARALAVGPHIGALCEAIHRQDDEVFVYAYGPANGNTGLDRTSFVVEAAR
jgi:hypothetical protein